MSHNISKKWIREKLGSGRPGPRLPNASVDEGLEMVVGEVVHGSRHDPGRDLPIYLPDAITLRVGYLTGGHLQQAHPK